MHFQRRPSGLVEPEVNLIPLIDILLVVLVFLMLSTSYSRLTELHVTLPSAVAEPQPDRPQNIRVRILQNGQYVIGKQSVASGDIPQLSQSLRHQRTQLKNPVLVIDADRAAEYQSIISLLEAARKAGIPVATFTTQTSGR